MQAEKRKLWFLLGFGILYCIVLAFLFQQIPLTVYNPDFHTRWYTSRQLFEIGRSIYDWQNAVDVSELTGWPLVHQLGYYYPAYLLIFTGPLSFLPYPIARLLWTIFGLFSLWLGTLLFLRIPRQVLSINQITIFLVAITTSVPVFQHTLNGQFNSIGVLSLGLTYWALTKRRYTLAGILAAGLLFKPQATFFALFFLGFWSLWRKERWKFVLGLAAAALGLWAVAELLEPNWVLTFLGTLGSYPEIKSVLMQLGDTYLLLSVTLGALTLWLFWRWREQEPADWIFRSCLLWGISLSVLVIPMFAMLHSVLLGPILALLFGIIADWKPLWLQRTWWGALIIFIAGLLVFIIALVFTGTSGLHMSATESVYRIIAPLLIGGIALTSLFSALKNTGTPSL